MLPWAIVFLTGRKHNIGGIAIWAWRVNAAKGMTGHIEAHGFADDCGKGGSIMGIQGDYLERCYAGWLGKIVGVRLGAPIEGWEYERIREELGENVFDYIVDYHEFAADDDTNGPMFFLRALEDYECSERLTAEQIGLTWLNYTPFEHGFYWWGGYGISTEHTAYLNLRAGIPAPMSGSIAQNGRTVAEQIGGQIFIDSWGLINPGNPERAARFAAKAASVSHDGEGVYGGMFVAGCIAEAFVNHDIRAVLEKGLSLIPGDCEYARMAGDVFRFHDAHPGEMHWRECFRFIRDHYGYDRYPGNCHIIPNSAVMILAMLYGGGDFTRTVGICNMCGWDTDCTTGNVGAIMGVLVGLAGIDYEKWLRPVHDFLACSSVLGCLNIMDVPANVYAMARIAYRLNGEAYPDRWRKILEGRAPRFNFALPGSTHAFRVSGAARHRLMNVGEEGSRRLRCLLQPDGTRVEIYHRTYYDSRDFTDSRYDPFFSPILYPGQRVSARVRLDAQARTGCIARAFAWDENHDRRIAGEATPLEPGAWTELSVQIPPIRGGLIRRAGISLERADGWNDWLIVEVADVDFSGSPDYSVDFALEREDRWTFHHREISQMSRLKGLMYLENGALHLSGADYAEGYTGDVVWRDYSVTGVLQPVAGGSHQIMGRVQGACRSYGLRLAGGGRLQLVKNVDTRDRVLAECAFPWTQGGRYRLTLLCEGNRLSALDDGGTVLAACTDEDRPYLNGAIGVGVQRGHCAFAGLEVRPNHGQR